MVDSFLHSNIFDNRNKPWLIEINPCPNQCENIKARTWNYAIYQEILEMIIAIDKNKQSPPPAFVTTCNPFTL